MKVLMLGRIGILENGGGDKVQIENTAEELRKLGAEVDVRDNLNVDISKYDIVHVFQLDWTAEPYFYAKKAKSYNKPLVLSPIHHDVLEVKKFDDEFVFDFRRVSKILFRDQFHRDVFKNAYRSFFDRRKTKPLLYSIFVGLKNMHRKILKLSDVVLVQTELEAHDLKKTYDVDFKWEKVQNGVGEQFLHMGDYENKLGIKDYIICVGRIEPRKNQLSIIRAVKMLREKEKLDVNLLFVGTKNVLKHFEYNFWFTREVQKNKWIKHISGWIPPETVASYYHFAKVGVSASWFETTGLTSLEVLFCGSNAVAAGDRAKEYLGNKASYCEPDNVESIMKAIRKEYYAKRPQIDEKMKREYTWKSAAKKTLEVYKNLLS